MRDILLWNAAAIVNQCVVYPFRQFRKRLAAGALPTIDEAIDLYSECWSELPADTERPIFILSAGWRSGSTLVQRCIMSCGDAMIWGEPYNQFGMLDSLGDPMRRLAGSGKFPAGVFEKRSMVSVFLEQQKGASASLPQFLSTKWVANLYPDLNSLRAAQRACIDTLLGQPARERGVARWGMKEVRLTAEHALFLQWLFPRAKFLFLYRNPYHSYRSYSSFRRSGWYHRSPDERVTGGYAFGKYWVDRVSGFQRVCDRVGGMLLRYEDFVRDRDAIARMEEYLEVRIDRSTLDEVIHSRGSLRSLSLIWADMLMLRMAVNPLAEELGYRLSDARAGGAQDG